MRIRLALTMIVLSLMFSACGCQVALERSQAEHEQMKLLKQTILNQHSRLGDISTLPMPTA